MQPTHFYVVSKQIQTFLNKKTLGKTKTPIVYLADFKANVLFALELQIQLGANSVGCNLYYNSYRTKNKKLDTKLCVCEKDIKKSGTPTTQPLSKTLLKRKNTFLFKNFSVNFNLFFLSAITVKQDAKYKFVIDINKVSVVWETDDPNIYIVRKLLTRCPICHIKIGSST